MQEQSCISIDKNVKELNTSGTWDSLVYQLKKKKENFQKR
jgi:hypothetical protein